MNRAALLEHLDYTAWASALLLEACDALSEEEVNRDLKGSHGGLAATLRHVYFADRNWFRRLNGAPRPFHQPGEAPTIADLKRDWPPLLQSLRDLVGGLSDAEIEGNLNYNTLKGVPCSVPRWQVLLHVVNHGTLHRGQAMAMLRQLGHTPPTTDLISYYLEQQARSASQG